MSESAVCRRRLPFKLETTFEGTPMPADSGKYVHEPERFSEPEQFLSFDEPKLTSTVETDPCDDVAVEELESENGLSSSEIIRSKLSPASLLKQIPSAADLSDDEPSSDETLSEQAGGGTTENLQQFWRRLADDYEQNRALPSTSVAARPRSWLVVGSHLPLPATSMIDRLPPDSKWRGDAIRLIRSFHNYRGQFAKMYACLTRAASREEEDDEEEEGFDGVSESDAEMSDLETMADSALFELLKTSLLQVNLLAKNKVERLRQLRDKSYMDDSDDDDDDDDGSAAEIEDESSWKWSDFVHIHRWPSLLVKCYNGPKGSKAK